MGVNFCAIFLVWVESQPLYPIDPSHGLSLTQFWQPLLEPQTSFYLLEKNMLYEVIFYNFNCELHCLLQPIVEEIN